MIYTKNLAYKVKGKTLLNDISLTFNPNEITMVIGANGAGKSTLIKLLSQQLTSTNGTIFYGDKTVENISTGKLAKVRAVLSQNVDLAFPLTVEQIVMMGRYPHFDGKPKEVDYEICKKAIDFFDISPMVNRNYLTLSGGEKQRVHFARIAAQIWPDSNEQTKYLLLDEPLTYLDVYYQYEFMRKIKELMKLQHMVVIGVVHDLNLAYRYADRMVLLHQGSTLAAGIPQVVFTPDNILNAFKVKARILKDDDGKEYVSL